MKIDLREVDLNLLVALSAVLSECSVTRAAKKVGVGQSAMSSSLSRLRKIFDDELLTRTTDGMILTPRAKQLVEPLNEILSRVGSLLHRDSEFDPMTVERTFHISLSDSSEILFAPKLLEHLQKNAPGIKLVTHKIDHDNLLDFIDAGTIDFAIGMFSKGQHHHRKRLLFRDEYVCIFNPATTNISTPISLEQYLSTPHVMTTLRESIFSVVDQALAKAKLKRNISFITPRFLSVPFIVRDAPVIATMHACLAKYFASSVGLSMSKLPVDLDSVEISLLWHTSHDSDPAHEWVRRSIVQLASGIVRTPDARPLKLGDVDAKTTK